MLFGKAGALSTDLTVIGAVADNYKTPRPHNGQYCWNTVMFKTLEHVEKKEKLVEKWPGHLGMA